MSKPLKILCANLRYAGANDGKNSWIYRKDLCMNVLRSRNPDLFCFQEMWNTQRIYVQTAFPGFDWSGMADEPLGRNTVNAIFYRREAFQLLSSSGYWLSETPHIPGSASWQSDCVRLANWVRLLHVETQHEFRLINTHLDHISQPARENQARMINEDAGAYSEAYPQILAGDMNSDPGNPAIHLFLRNGWKDTYQAVHGIEDPGYTFHEFQGPEYDSKIGKIDWIFTRGKIEVLQAEVMRDSLDGRYPSDHYFILVQFDILG